MIYHFQFSIISVTCFYTISDFVNHKMHKELQYKQLDGVFNRIENKAVASV